MILEETFFAVKCDNCGKVNENYDGISFWASKECALELSVGEDWEEIEGKHYCPDCFEVNDEDEIIIKTQELPIRCITFDKEAQDNLPEHIKAKMKADKDKARANKVFSLPECVFNYCPHPNECKIGGCLSKKTT